MENNQRISVSNVDVGKRPGSAVSSLGKRSHRKSKCETMLCGCIVSLFNLVSSTVAYINVFLIGDTDSPALDESTSPVSSSSNTTSQKRRRVRGKFCEAHQLLAHALMLRSPLSAYKMQVCGNPSQNADRVKPIRQIHGANLAAELPARPAFLHSAGPVTPVPTIKLLADSENTTELHSSLGNQDPRGGSSANQAFATNMVASATTQEPMTSLAPFNIFPTEVPTKIIEHSSHSVFSGTNDVERNSKPQPNPNAAVPSRVGPTTTKINDATNSGNVNESEEQKPAAFLDHSTVSQQQYMSSEVVPRETRLVPFHVPHAASQSPAPRQLSGPTRNRLLASTPIPSPERLRGLTSNSSVASFTSSQGTPSSGNGISQVVHDDDALYDLLDCTTTKLPPNAYDPRDLEDANLKMATQQRMKVWTSPRSHGKSFRTGRLRFVEKDPDTKPIWCIVSHPK